MDINWKKDLDLAAADFASAPEPQQTSSKFTLLQPLLNISIVSATTVSLRKETKQVARTNFNWDFLSTSDQRVLLEVFAREFQVFLRGTEHDSLSKSEIIERVGKAVGKKIDVRQFDSFLRYLFQDGYLCLKYHLLPERANDICSEQKLDFLEKITVVAGADKHRFARAAAEDFIKRIFEIAKIKRKAKRSSGENTLNVGIISGNTTGEVIRAVMDINWKKDLDLAAADLPVVQVFALNVCLTVPRHLSGNATILSIISLLLSESCSVPLKNT